MKGFLQKYFSFVLAAVCFCGCSKEEQPGGGAGDAVQVNFPVSTRALSLQDGGVVIAKVRVIAFDEQNRLALNATTGDGLEFLEGTTASDAQFALALPIGGYDLKVIANETEEMTALLSVVKNKSDLIGIKVQGDFTEENIPLFMEESIMVDMDDSGSVPKPRVSADGGVTWNDGLELELMRTQCKVSLFLRKSNGAADDIVINKVELCNYPEFSFLMPAVYDPVAPLTRIVFESETGISLGDDATTDNTDLTSYKTIFTTGNIFPEVRLTDATDASKATYLKVYASLGNVPVEYIIRLGDDTALPDYDMDRSIDYRVYCTISSDLKVFILQPKWDSVDVPGDITIPYLNLSEVMGDIYIYDPDTVFTASYTFHFWSNCPKSEIAVPELGDSTLFDSEFIFRDETNDADGNPQVSGTVTFTLKDPDAFYSPIEDMNVVTKQVFLQAGTLRRPLYLNLISDIPPMPSSVTK